MSLSYDDTVNNNRIIKPPIETEEQRVQRIKERIREEGKRYRIKHYDKLHKKKDCECGGSYISPHKARHLITKKHLLFMNQ
jgi:hypothetical protein